MAALDYTDDAVMNSLVLEITGLTEPTDLDSLLEDSAGTHTAATVTVYRPYYVAAKLLERALNTKRLQSADGAVFDRPAVTIRGLMRQQAARDKMLAEDHADWVVPDGHEAIGAGRATVTF
jgi:hypothetical protein